MRDVGMVDLLMAIIVIIAVALIGFMLATYCDTGCKIERYLDCRAERPELDEIGCLIIVID
jgi:hypothetical protein